LRAKARRASAVSLEHLPSLDGIRGVAVLAIITTHTIGVIPGGFLSVDVFFALSGYLITSLLVAEWRSSSAISLGRFWSRRARRLLPALFLMLTPVGAGAAMWPQIFDTPTLRSDTISTVLYGANWHFIAQHTSYFKQYGTQSPLTHTWSLAIEEQFYLVWPIVVLAVLRLRRPRRGGAQATDVWATDVWATDGEVGPDPRRRLCVLFGIAVTGALASATWMAVLTRSGAETTRAYYGSDTRAQAILVGAALALGLALWEPARSPTARAVLRMAGVAGVLGTALLWLLMPVDSPVAFRGGFLLAALCTAGVIACVSQLPRTAVGSALSWRPIGYVGRISYGMYLWYWPLVLVLSPGRTHVTGLPLLAERLVCIIAVASASAYLVELPIRRGQLPRWWIPLAMPTAAGLAVLTTFLATVEVAPVAAAPRVPARGALGGAQTTVSYAPPVKLLMVGDSVAGTLGVGLGLEMAQYDVVAVNEGSPGCSVSMDQMVQVLWFTDPPGSPCQNGNPDTLLNQWKAWVDQFNPDVVIYMARSEVLNQEIDSQWMHAGEPAFDAYLVDRFHEAISVLGSRGAHVVLLTSPYYDTGLQPSGAPWPEDDPARVNVDNQIIESMATAPTVRSSSRRGSASHARHHAGQPLFGQDGVTVIDTGAWLSPGGQFATTVNGVRTRCGDGVHFTVAGGEWLARRILPVVSLLGRAHQAASPNGSWSGDIALTPPSWYSKLPCGPS
jgi:peptidoglycan/LPS O-acetylase OafA/YrhL